MSGLKIKIKFGGSSAQQSSQQPSASGDLPLDRHPSASAAISGAASEKPKKKKKKRPHEDVTPTPVSQSVKPLHASGAVEQPTASRPLRISFKGSWLAGSSKPAATDAAAEQPKKKKKHGKEQNRPLTIRLPTKSSAPSTAGWDHQLATAAAQAAVAATQSGSHMGAYRPSATFGALPPKQAKAKQPKPSPPAGEPRTSSRKKRKTSSAVADGQSPAELDTLRAGSVAVGGEASKLQVTGAVSGPSDTSAAPAVAGVKVEEAAAEEEGPEVPMTQEAVERVINKVQKKDMFQIFKEPVTDEVAPGYSAAIKRPMDFSTMRRRFAEGVYSSWEVLQDDMRTMFTNAMTFNPPGTLYHKQANTLLALADKLIALARRGIKDMRGRTAGVVRAHTASLAAQVKQERDAVRAAQKAEVAAARATKLAEEGGAQQAAPKAPTRVGRPVTRVPKEMAPPVAVDETVRNTYPARCRDAAALSLRGLACGANAEGVAYGRQVLVPLQASASTPSYVSHLTTFLAGLKGRMKSTANSILDQYIAQPKPSVTAAAPAATPAALPGTRTASIAHAATPASAAMQAAKAATPAVGLQVAAGTTPVSATPAIAPSQPQAPPATQPLPQVAVAPQSQAAQPAATAQPPSAAASAPPQPAATQPPLI